jgi:hypothetical protein
MSFRVERSTVEEPRGRILKVAPRDPSTSLGMTRSLYGTES